MSLRSLALLLFRAADRCAPNPHHVRAGTDACSSASCFRQNPIPALPSQPVRRAGSILRATSTKNEHAMTERSHITVILDRAGSMQDIREDEVSGFSAFPNPKD